MKRWEQKKHLVGICFLLLIVGSECTRIIENVERHGRIAKDRLTKAHQQTFENPEVATVPEAVKKLEAPEGELARGILHFRKETQPCYAILRSGVIDDDEGEHATVQDEGESDNEDDPGAEEDTEGGSMTLDLYPIVLKDQKQKDAVEAYTMDDFKQMKPMPKKWSRVHRIILRHDDMALMSQDKKAKAPSLKLMAEHFWLKNWEKNQYGSKREELDVSAAADDEHQIIFLKGSDSWYEIGDAGELLKSWTTAIRTLQTSNTCLERGTCIMQCTYIPSDKACNSPEFCNLVDRKDKYESGMWFWKKTTRKRCEGVQGVTANKVAWGDMTTVARQKAMKIGADKCVYDCGDAWNVGNQVKQMALSLYNRFKEALADEDLAKKFGDMREFMEQVVAEAPGTAEYITEKMGVAWDARRKGDINEVPLARVMKEKGCRGLEDGSLQAINAAAFDPDNEELDALVNKYEEQCPLYSEAESEGLDELLKQASQVIAINKNDGIREDDDFGSLIEMAQGLRMSPASFVQQSSNTTSGQMVVYGGQSHAIPVLIWALGAVAIVSAAIGVTLFLSSRRCAQKESSALKRCRQKFLEEPSECDKDFSMGMWFSVAGGVLMVATLSAVMFTGAIPTVAGVVGAGGVKGLGSKVASHVAGTAAWKAMQYAAKQESIKTGVTKYLQKSSMVLGAYFWSKCRKSVAGEPPSDTQVKLWKLQEANFRTCMAENNEPMNSAEGQAADKLLVQSSSLDALKADLAAEEGPTAGDIVTDLTKSAWKQVVEWPGQKDFAVDLMKILTENKQVVNIPGVGEIPMETVLSMAEQKIRSDTLVGEGEEAVEVPGFGKLPVKLLVMLNQGKETIVLPGLGEVKLKDVIERMRKPTDEEMEKLPIVLSGYVADATGVNPLLVHDALVNKGGKGGKGKKDDKEPKGPKTTGGGGSGAAATSEDEDDDEEDVPANTAGGKKGPQRHEEDDEAKAAEMNVPGNKDKNGTFAGGPSFFLIAMAAFLLAWRGELC